MNCNCITETEKLMSGDYPDAKCKAVGFSFSTKNINASITIPFEYTKFKKDGTEAKAKGKISFLAAYCPFCGMSALKEDNSNGNIV